MNLLEEHRHNGKKRPTTASCGAYKNEGNSFHNLGVASIARQLRLVPTLRASEIEQMRPQQSVPT
ncbi:hypothetical protein [Pseudomonas canadensis]|uniref:hypothetical protein n=1 Tax=Pseudomonas canadensis TaxID=915099 RepID=UPI003B9E64FE